jgi:signal peptidase II
VAARGRALTVLLVVAAVVFGLDHLTKWLVVRNIPLNDEVPSSGPITFHHVRNSGAAFGLFPQLHSVFLGIAVLVSIYIIFVGPRYSGGLPTQMALGAILGGAAANAVDRFSQGYVVDFIDLHRWPVFNVADSAIVLGVIVAVFAAGRGSPRATDGSG